MKIEIKSITGNIIFSHECEDNSIRKTLDNAVIADVYLSEANLSGANLSEANLSGANLSRANLSEANLSGANLSEANLSGANLSEANLSGANLSRADLRWADLSEANLNGADLSEANLSGADLSGANLRRANLSGADLSRANLVKAGLRDAVLPEGVPVVPDIHKKIYEAITTSGNTLHMGAWHTCETTHCRAGWAIHLAGKEGYELERKYGSSVAGALIYQASDPKLKCIPDWYAHNEEALADIKRRANVLTTGD